MEFFSPEKAVGFMFLCVPVFYWWEKKRTRGWLTTKAKVIEIDPKSMWKREGLRYTLNLDTDYAIEYEVDGKKYVQTPSIENNIHLGPFKMWRSPSIPEEFDVRYDPKNPDRYSYSHTYSRAFILMLYTLCMVIGIFLLVFWE